MKRLIIAAPLLAVVFSACGSSVEESVEYRSPNRDRVTLDGEDSSGYDADVDEVEINGRTCYVARSYESIALDCVEGD